MITIVIPAKGGSGRLPNKNMALVNGRPMLDYTIDSALASKRGADIYVSTDSDAIAAHAASRGIKVIRRSADLCGEALIIAVYRHALAEIGNDEITAIVGLQPDHPDRDLSVDEAIAVFEKEAADLLYSTEPDGTKSGAHYIVSRHYLDTDECRKKVPVIDDCTNIHYQEDIPRAERRLREKMQVKENGV